MFRSETMQHGSLILPIPRARDLMEMLGSQFHIQFVDMNENTLNRQYTLFIKRITEMEKILRFMHEEMMKLPGIKILQEDVSKFLQCQPGYQLDKLERSLQDLYGTFKMFRENNAAVRKEKSSAIEEQAVLQAAMASFGSLWTPPNIQAGPGEDVSDVEMRVEPVTLEDGVCFTTLAGVIVSSEEAKFSRTLFITTRGNVFTYITPIQKPLIEGDSEKPVHKSVFVAYFQSSQGPGSLRNKLENISRACGATLYEWPKSSKEAADRLSSLEKTIAEKNQTLDAYEEFLVQETVALLEVGPGGSSCMEEYRLFCLKEKAIYATLNMFQASETTLRADCWFPKSEEEPIRICLQRKCFVDSQLTAFLFTDKNGLEKQQPPTFFRTTQFTECFQNFVDTYGIARYKEINPALLTIVMLPFLFGIMYGDVGHGICLLAFSIYLIRNWNCLKTSKNEILQMLLQGRYMILLMSLFSIYAGFLYNDFFSLGIDLFGTRYKIIHDKQRKHHIELDTWQRTVYPFGIDPMWKGAVNEMTLMNSFKMKFSVIVAGFQMTVGLILRAMNDIYFQDYAGFFLVFIPQLVFLSSFVGYMDFLIFYKWLTPEIINEGRSNKPYIINNVIEMCLLKNPTLEAFRGHKDLMKVCFALMVATAPIMLLGKPAYLASKRIRERLLERNVSKRLESVDPTALPDKEVSRESQATDFSQLMIYQLIDTIEFVLGCISNTASYLRLWALSLAHQQLSAIFYQMTVEKVLELEVSAVLGALLLFFVFPVFALLTFGVMLCMDSLECYLHALRLQWVEFQSKFYKADGYPFKPFYLETILEDKHE